MKSPRWWISITLLVFLFISATSAIVGPESVIVHIQNFLSVSSEIRLGHVSITRPSRWFVSYAKWRGWRRGMIFCFIPDFSSVYEKESSSQIFERAGKSEETISFVELEVRQVAQYEEIVRQISISVTLPCVEKTSFLGFDAILSKEECLKDKSTYSIAVPELALQIFAKPKVALGEFKISVIR